MTSRLLVAFAAALLFGGTMSARQEPARRPAPQGPQPQTFRSLVQVIEVDVRVFDKDGRFVTGLTREDFEVVEEGTPQQVDAMYFVENPARPAAIATPDATPAAPTPAPPASPAAPQTWIFIFDLNHLTPGGGFDRARKAVEDFIRDRFRDGDLAGIVAGDKMVNNRLTSVRAELLQAVTQVKPVAASRTRQMELTRDWPRLLNEEEAIQISREDRQAVERATIRACSDDPDRCREADMMVRSKGRTLAGEFHRAATVTLSSINALASGLARIPGPKTVVFLSDGFVSQQIETTLRSVIGQVARAGGRVYAIDVRGLGRVGQTGFLDQASVDDEVGPVVRSDGYADGPNSLAVDTGGMMIRNENNIGRALTRIADDAGRYYVLAYRPANVNLDGKFRAVQVRVKREGVRVRARRGYLALEPARMRIPQTIKPLSDAAPEGPGDPAVESGADTPPAATGAAVSAATVGTAAVPAAAPATAVRLRPDSQERVQALSTRETAAASGFARSGWDAYQRGDVETALSHLSKAAAQQEVRPWVLYALGMSQAALGRGTEAIGSWERVRRAVPDFEPVYMDLAETHAQLSDLTTALGVLRDAEGRWPKNAEVKSAIGVIHVRRGALDDGIAALGKATDLAPDDPLMHLNLARAYQLRFVRGRRYVTSQRRWVAPDGDRQKAAEAFQRCIALGGPYAQQAREALSMLDWSKSK